MAVNDPQKQLGSYTVYTSTGATATVRYGMGSVIILHEYVAAMGGWTGIITGQTNPAKINGIDVANINKVIAVT